MCLCVWKLPSWCEQYAHCAHVHYVCMHAAVACAQCTMLKSVIPNVELSPMTTQFNRAGGGKWCMVCKSKLYFQAKTTILFISFGLVFVLCYSGFSFYFFGEQNDPLMFAYTSSVLFKTNKYGVEKNWLKSRIVLARMLLNERIHHRTTMDVVESERVREKIRLVGCSIN